MSQADGVLGEELDLGAPVPQEVDASSADQPIYTYLKEMIGRVPLDPTGHGCIDSKGDSLPVRVDDRTVSIFLTRERMEERFPLSRAAHVARYSEAVRMPWWVVSAETQEGMEVTNVHAFHPRRNLSTSEHGVPVVSAEESRLRAIGKEAGAAAEVDRLKRRAQLLQAAHISEHTLEGPARSRRVDTRA